MMKVAVVGDSYIRVVKSNYEGIYPILFYSCTYAS